MGSPPAGPAPLGSPPVGPAPVGPAPVGPTTFGGGLADPGCCGDWPRGLERITPAGGDSPRRSRGLRDETFHVIGARVRSQPDPDPSGRAEPEMVAALPRVEMARRSVHAALGKCCADVLDIAALDGEEERRSPPARVAVHRHPGERAQVRLQEREQALLVGLDCGIRPREPISPRAVGASRQLVVEPCQEVDRCRHPRQQLVGQRPQLEALRHRVGRRQELVGPQLRQQLGPRPQHPEMRTEELVGRAHPEVGAACRHVGQHVGAGMHSVNPEQRSCVVGDPTDCGQVRARPDEVGRRGDGHQPGPLRHDGRDLLR